MAQSYAIHVEKELAELAADPFLLGERTIKPETRFDRVDLFNIAFLFGFIELRYLSYDRGRIRLGRRGARNSGRNQHQSGNVARMRQSVIDRDKPTLRASDEYRRLVATVIDHGMEIVDVPEGFVGRSSVAITPSIICY